ncbi:Sec-independent protein translocase subunit TatA/TatB [Lignipirellula cremea]|uniref:Twin arginine translocase protein A n=1 Tax=Lignipirellula cremea TaxID=2528010 RepID=A0A518E3K2_9BACT|nr:twin-arginine translocase TatA/TatE family subunit [Lignipirellula cremea]QDU98676.1 twin arginine translocase protein A [Lignipirellula cremea]
MFGLPGHLELLIIAGIILLLFGHRLPGVMRSLGTGIKEFKTGLHTDPDHADNDSAKENVE